MRRGRKPVNVEMTELKFGDLLAVDHGVKERNLVNLKVPADVLARVHHLASKLGVTKTATVVALLNEGIQEAQRRGLGVKH